jgi:drug/metabolite transporter (DMT)-like permease
VFAAGITVVLWASAFVGIRAAAPYYSPGSLALGRLLAGSVTLLAFLWLRGGGRPRGGGLPSRAAWPGIVISGVLWFGLYMVVLNWGEREVDAGTAAMVVNVGPIVMALLAGWLLHEGFPPRLLGGLVVSCGGAIVVGVSISDGGRASMLGVLLCLAAAVSYAAGAVAQKPALRHATALQVTTFGCVIGTVACLPFAGQLAADVVRAPAHITLTVVYLGVFPTALAFTTWAYALARTTAGRMGSTTYLVPVMVIVISALVLHEVPPPLAVLGGVLCLAGVAVSRGRRQTPAQVATQEAAPSGDPVEAAHGEQDEPLP